MASALEELLKRLAVERAAPLPDPAAPVGLGPLSTDTSQAFQALNPEPVPPRFTQPAPVDMNLVNQFAGPAPVAPVPDSPNALDKLAAILGGIAGGPGYGLALKEERDRPIREYNAQLERYQGRRAQGVELAERRSERDAAQANRAAEAQYERDFNAWLKKTGVRDEAAKAAMRQAYELEQIRERERVADEKLGQQQRAQQERDARLIARDFGKVGAKPEIALQLGRYYSGLVDEISPEAAKFESAQARLAEVRLRRAASGGSGGGGVSGKAQKAAAEIQSIKDRMIEAEARGDQQTVKQLMMRAKTVIRNSARFPEIEAGFDQSGKWPYVKMRGQGQAQAQPAQTQAGPLMATPPPDAVQAYMQMWGITDRNQAIRELMGQQ